METIGYHSVLSNSYISKNKVLLALSRWRFLAMRGNPTIVNLLTALLPCIFLHGVRGAMVTHASHVKLNSSYLMYHLQREHHETKAVCNSGADRAGIDRSYAANS